MTRSSTETRVLPQRHLAGALMLGAALALVPLAGFAQDAQTAPMKNASPAANTTAQAGAEGGASAAAGTGDTGAPSAEAAAGRADAAETAATPSAEAAASGAAATGGPAAAGQFRQAGGVLRNAEGADVGSVLITETASGVMHFVLDVSEGAVPAAQHGLHIHETGVCEGPAFETAGGHLAGGKDHGVHSANGPHVGDLPNITMGASGALHVEYFLPGVLMDQILDDDGAAVIIHSEVDDYTSQPSGNSGDRIACAVLELSS